MGGEQDEWSLDRNSSPDGLYSDGLTQLATSSTRSTNSSSTSYALAVVLNCLDADDHEQKSAVCLLADRNIVQAEYGSSRSTSGMTFYYLAFLPVLARPET